MLLYTLLKLNFLKLYFYNMALCTVWHDKMCPGTLRYKIMAQFFKTYLHVCKPLVYTIASVSNFHFKIAEVGLGKNVYTWYSLIVHQLGIIVR